MYYLKLDLKSTEEQLAEELSKISNSNVKVIASVGLLDTTDIIVAIIAATPVILAQVAGIIKAYIERNKNKSFTIKINGEEMSFTGYNTEEIDIILQKYGKQDE